ncbi:MAG: ABC transporter permease [Peptococcaceae bacterium]|jgi:peptide/nickel transport system permease protein|nr:ABC transporter permease [Peptococcaceae bacterium]
MANQATSKKKVTLADRFRYNKAALFSLIVLIVIFLMMLFAEQVTAYRPTQGDLYARLAPPSFAATEKGPAHIMGTDQLGQDVYSRLLYGGRVSLTVGFVVAFVGALIGITLGMFAGYFGGWIDMVIMRMVDVWSSSPTLLVALTFVMVLGPGKWNLIIALLVNSWTLFCRMARSQVLVIRSSAMVESGHAIGASTNRIMFRHIMPNIISPLVTTFVLELAHFINAESNLSFLGFGVQPPDTSWGLMIGEGRKYLTQAPWIVLFPGLSIGVTVLCLNLVGNWIRDEFDPLAVKQ